LGARRRRSAAAADRRVIALGARGHGESDKPHPAAYENGAMARREGLLDHLGVERSTSSDTR
jgi:pimeloyl-ACP methyl ester carboxylesterase